MKPERNFPRLSPIISHCSATSVFWDGPTNIITFSSIFDIFIFHSLLLVSVHKLTFKIKFKQVTSESL